MNKCPYCNHLNKNDSKNCSKCGKDLDSIIIMCPSCSKRYRIKIPDTPKKYKCKKCGGTIIVKPENIKQRKDISKKPKIIFSKNIVHPVLLFIIIGSIIFGIYLFDSSKRSQSKTKLNKKTERTLENRTTINIEKKKKEYVIIDNLGSARILSRPLNGQEFGRIPAGTKVEILEKQQARSGALSQTWYLVNYNNLKGWISQYVTKGNIITEYETGESEIKRAPNAENSIASFDEQSKQDFKKWAIKNTSVTWLEYQDDGIIWIKLSPHKYTTKENVSTIARTIARYYKIQTNYQHHVIVTVWDLYENKIWAKGNYP